MEGRLIRLKDFVTEIARVLYIYLLIVIVFLGWTILPDVVIAVRQFFHNREENWRHSFTSQMVIRSGDIKDAFGLQLISSIIVLFMLGVLGFVFWRGILDFLMSIPVFVWYAWVGIDVAMFVIGAKLESHYRDLRIESPKPC